MSGFGWLSPQQGFFWQTQINFCIVGTVTVVLAMKYRWTLSDLVFPQDQGLLTERLTDRFQPLSEVAQRYRLEAKYLLAGEVQPYSSIVLPIPIGQTRTAYNKSSLS